VEVWEILMTDEVEQFLDTLYESDRDTHKLVNQAILVLERNCPAKGGHWSTLSPGRRSRT
jgi:hypothetical protein